MIKPDVNKEDKQLRENGAREALQSFIFCVPGVFVSPMSSRAGSNGDVSCVRNKRVSQKFH